MLRNKRQKSARLFVVAESIADNADEKVMLRQSFAMPQDLVEHSRVRANSRIEGQGVILVNDRLQDSHRRGATALGTNFRDPGIVEDKGPDPILLREHAPGGQSGSSAAVTDFMFRTLPKNIVIR